MDLREEQRRSKRPARSRARTRLIEEDAETEASYGSLENSGTESSLHGDESSNLGDSAPTTELVPAETSSSSSKPKNDEKRCAFCWRGRKSSLGQGILTRCEPTAGFNPFRKALKGRQGSTEQEASKRRCRSDQSKSPGRAVETGKYANVYNELSDVGLPLDVTVAEVFVEPDRAIYAHHCCAAWNDGVLQAEDYSLQYVDKFAFSGLSSKCSLCEKYGGTIPCKAPRCYKKYHYPCASGGGCFQDVKTFTLLCPDHLDMAESTAKDESHCVVCNEPGNIHKQLFCTSCGQHYHGDCLEFEVECNTVVRAGWQCPECKVCQECRKPGDDNRMLVCDVCDKGFHTFCLVPAINKVPPNGWRCHNCRSCVECGLRSNEMKWHRNHTLCNNCHQQKLRGPSCPVCKKSYKQSNVKGMTLCTACNKFVHNTCDKDITDKTDAKKYQCPACLSAVVSSPIHDKADSDIAEVSLDDVMELRERFDADSERAESEKMSASSASSRIRPVKPGRGKPASFTRGKVVIKRPVTKSARTSSSATASRSKGKVMKKRVRPTTSEKQIKRTKIKENIATTHSAAPSAESVRKLDDDDHYAAVVLAATSDLYVLTQDMCMSCGSYGKGSAADLITCTQCGQCYHPFCVQVKVNEVILTKGWRCLDCTVCEGCGKPTDEPKLLLCDECDISYHIYCLDPPLTQVPKGNWKCKWCVHCRYCGSADPGFGCEWINNYTECGPCHSVTDCPICDECYMDNELVIQCNQCQRWLHASCDNMKTEDDTERMSSLGYHCLHCRPKTGAQSPRPPTPEPATPSAITSPVVAPAPKEESKAYSVDGVVLSEYGLDLIREVTLEQPVSQFSIAQKAAQAARLARNRQMKIKQTHPQMSQLLSVTSNTSETPMDEDAAATQVDEAGQPVPSKDGGDPAAASESVLSPTSGDAPKVESWAQQPAAADLSLPADALAAATDPNKAKKRSRKPPPLGIGGFIAKPRSRPPPKQVVYGPVTADGQPPILLKDPSASADVDASGEGAIADPSKKKIVRKMKKKGIIEDTYPIYLQDAFFGKDSLEQGKQGTASITSEPATLVHQPSLSLTEQVPDSCIIRLAEGITIPPPQVFPTIAPAPAEIKEVPTEEVPQIDGDDLDILPGVSADILPGGLHEEELYKIFDDIQSEAAEAREAGPVDSKSAMRVSEDADMEIDAENLEDFLKNIMENDASAEAAAAGVLSGLPVDAADHRDVTMAITPAINANSPAMQQQQQRMLQPTTAQQSLPTQPMSQQQMQHHMASQPPAQQQLPASHQPQMADPFNPLPSSYPQAPPPTIPPIGSDFNQPSHPPMLPSSVAGSLPGSLPGSHPGTPFSPSTFNEPSWPAAAGGAGDPEDAEHMSLNQKNMLKWKEDEMLGLDATISPVLYSNTMHQDLKVQYPDWTERCKQIGKYWRKMNTEQRTPYLQKARENRHKRAKQNKSARRKQTKENAGGSPRGAGMSPGSSLSIKPELSSNEASLTSTDVQFPAQPILPTDDQGEATVAGQSASASAALVEQDVKPQPMGPLPDQFRPDVYPPPGFSGRPSPLNQRPNEFAAGNSAKTPSTSLGEPDPAAEATLNSSAGLAMNTDDVRKQHLRELLALKQGAQGTGAEAMDWSSASNPRPEFSAPPGPSTTYPSQRGWSPLDANVPIRGQFAPRPDGWSGGQPGGQHVIRPTRSRYPHPQTGFRPRSAGAMHPGRLPAPQMMVDGTRMPSRMAGPHAMQMYADSYHARMAQPARMMEGGQGQGQPPLGSMEAMAGRSGDVTQEPLDDLLNDDGQFNLLPFNDIALDETLAEIHDKNMFDEHLGLMKEADENFQPESFPSAPKEEPKAAESTSKPDNHQPGSKEPKQEVGEQSNCSQSRQDQQSATPSISKASDPASSEAKEVSSASAKASTSKASPILATQAKDTSATTTISSTVTSTQTSETTSAPKTSAATSRPPSVVGSPRVAAAASHPSAGGCSPHPAVANSPHSTGQYNITPSPQSHTSTAPITSPYPTAGTPLVPGSPHPMAMVPGSPHPMALVPGSPHPMALVPGSPHPHAGGAIIPGSPHPYAGGAMIPGSPHPHVSGAGVVPGSPHPMASGTGAVMPPSSSLSHAASHPHGSTPVIPGSPMSHPGMVTQQGLAGASPQHMMAVQSPASASGMEHRPYSRQGSVDQPMFQRPAPDMSYMGGEPMSSIPASPYTRLLDPRVANPHPLHELLEEEKRQQQLAKQEDEAEGRSSAALLSDQDFEKLRADVANDQSGAPGMPQTSPRARFDAHQQMPTDVWQQPAANMPGDFPPPPPPPYPGTGRITPGGHIRPPYMPDHRSSAMPGMPPHPQGARMPMMPGEMRHEEMLRAKEAESKERLGVKEKELNQLRKRKKTLANKQKTLKKNNDDLTPQDANVLDQLTNQDIPFLAKEVESLRNEYKGHQRNLQEFSMKMQERMMAWPAGHMMPRYPNYPPNIGMMPQARMRSMYGQSRPMDPRQMDPRQMDPRQMELDHQRRHRMQMMQGMRPGMHPMQRPPYMEGGMDSASAMFGGPRYSGMATRMPMKMDGSEFMDEEKRQFMMQQQNAAMARPGMRPMTPDMAARMHQPQQMQPRFPGGGSKAREAAPAQALQRQKSAPAPKTSTSSTPKQPSKEDPPEKSSLHTATIPTSFPGQHLTPGPKPIVSAMPFTSGQNKHTPAALESIPKEAMTSLGNQYPLKIVKAEPKPDEAKSALKPAAEAKPRADGDVKVSSAPVSVATGSKGVGKSSAAAKTSTTSSSTVNADGTTLEDRIQATIDGVALRAAEMADMGEHMEAESRKEAEKRSLAAQAGYPSTGGRPDSGLTPSTGSKSPAPGSASTPKQDSSASNAAHRLGIPVSVVTNNQERTTPVSMGSGDLQHPIAQPNSTAVQQGHPSVQQGHSSVQQGHPSVQQGHPSIQQGHPSVQQGHPSVQQGHPSTLQGHPSTHQGHPSVQQQMLAEEARMTPNGQIITDNGTIISVPNSRPPPPPMPMHMNPGSAIKSNPLHAMQNMRSALVADPGMAHHAAAAAAVIAGPKKKRPPQGDKKKKAKGNNMPGLGASPATTPTIPAAVGPAAAAALSETTRLYEELKQKLLALPAVPLQEPMLSATSYMETIQPFKPVRQPNQRMVGKAKPSKLAGEYGRSCVEGQCDLYSYQPYTNIPAPVLRPSSALSNDSPVKKGGMAKPSKTPDSTQPSEVYDISRFHKVMSKTQMLDLNLPSPPLLQPTEGASQSLSPLSLVEPSSPEWNADDCVSTERSRREMNYPYLKPIKLSNADQLAPTDHGRMSPDIPVYVPVPVRVPRPSHQQREVKRENQVSTLDQYGKDPFGSMAEEELKSTAVGIQSSLQSAIRESPSNQVSVTLTLTSEAAQDIPNVLSKLADLLRMAAPPIPSQVSDLMNGEKGVMELSDGKGQACCHCDTLIPPGSAVVRGHKGIPLSTSDVKEQVDTESLHFCGEDCLVQYTLSRQQAEHSKDSAMAMGDDSKSLVNRNNPKRAKRKGPEAAVKPSKKWKGKRWRRWDIKVTFDMHKYEPPTEDEIKSTLRKVAQLVKPKPLPSDTRVCILCHRVGDGDNSIASRLLNYDVDKWVHLNCALWSTEVYETLNGALMNVDHNIQKCVKIVCVICGQSGATLGCFKPRCTNLYHVYCAYKHGAVFYEDKTLLCPAHINTEATGRLKQLTVTRKVYINRDESLQIANAVKSDDKQCCVRIGAVVYYSIGQLFTHQILTGKFHNRDYIYPVGYRCVRFFWSTRYPNKRCCYECSIVEGDEGAPVFMITIKEAGHSNTVYKDTSAKGAWSHILSIVDDQRRRGDCVKIFPEFLSGEYMFGLKESAIIRIIESLPGTELLAGYAFKFGKTQLIEMPPAINPTGCARSEPKLRTHFRKPHTLQTSSNRSTMLPSMTTVALPGDVNSPYHKQFVHSKSQQYRKLKNEWSNYVFLGRSRIQGLGMFAARDIEKHTMVIEYIGEVIRNELAEYREKIYEEHNRGVYMFRNTPDYVVDATMSGGPARYINHSCDPNCVTETVTMDKDVKIVIIALRRIAKGEELNYDYKFDLEDDSSKIPCNCGASNCRKWMN